MMSEYDLLGISLLESEARAVRLGEMHIAGQIRDIVLAVYDLADAENDKHE